MDEHRRSKQEHKTTVSGAAIRSSDCGPFFCWRSLPHPLEEDADVVYGTVPDDGQPADE